MKPAWQTDELEDEWVDQDEEQPSASVIHNASDLSLTRPIGSVLIPNMDSDEDTSHSDAPSLAGTFLIREDLPAAPILPKTPGKGKKGLVKDFFSPLALEKMFEPPSPPMNESTPLPPPPTTAPAIPSRLSQVHFPNQDSSVSEGAHADVASEGQDHVPEPDQRYPSNTKDLNAAGTYKFTFSAPRPSPFNLVGPIPNAHSTPGPFRTPQHPPSTDPRLRLFHFQYDTFTRDHLSAMVDSIAVNTPSGASASEPSARGEGTPGVSERSFSRLRSAKRIKLTSPSEFSPSGDGAAFIIRPDDGHRDYVGEARSLMEKIRQTRDFSTISTTTTAQSPMNQRAGRPPHGLNASRESLLHYSRYPRLDSA